MEFDSTLDFDELIYYRHFHVQARQRAATANASHQSIIQLSFIKNAMRPEINIEREERFFSALQFENKKKTRKKLDALPLAKYRQIRHIIILYNIISISIKH